MPDDAGVPIHKPYRQPNQVKKWYEKPFGIVLLMVIGGLIVAYCVYYFGWN